MSRYVSVRSLTAGKYGNTGSDEKLDTTSSESNRVADDFVTIGEAAAIIGFSVKTLQRWDQAGHFKAHRTPGGRRYYLRSELDGALKRAA